MRVPLFSSSSVSPLMPLLEWWQLDVQRRLLGLWHGICLQICRKRTNNLFYDKCFCMEINRKRASITFEPNLIANWQHASKTVLQNKKCVYKFAVKKQKTFWKCVCLHIGRKRARHLFEKNACLLNDRKRAKQPFVNKLVCALFAASCEYAPLRSKVSMAVWGLVSCLSGLLNCTAFQFSLFLC